MVDIHPAPNPPRPVALLRSSSCRATSLWYPEVSISIFVQPVHVLPHVESWSSSS